MARCNQVSHRAHDSRPNGGRQEHAHISVVYVQLPSRKAILAPINGACISRQVIPSGLGSACDDRVQQPVALIRQPQIRDMKVCLELRQLPQILVGSYSLVGLDTWAWFFWRHDGINPYMWLSQIEKVN